MQDIGLISIIMAAYNAEKTIDQAIRSVLAQSYPNWELIVVNDCSGDGTAALVESYADPRIVLINNPSNMGVSLTRARAVQAARGEWIAILDSDDLWAADKLEKQAALQAQSGASLLFTASTFITAEGTPIDWVLHAPAEIDYRALLKQNLVSNSSVLVKKSLYLEHQAIGDDMHEDFACWLKILRTGEKAYGIDEPLLIYRMSPSSKTGNKLRSAKMNWNTYRAVGLNTAESAYYMVFYLINGLVKYSRLKEVRKVTTAVS